MKECDWLPIFVCVIILANGHIVQSREYYIKERQIPSFMYRKFENVKEDIFPNSVSIDVSFSNVIGTLLYTIDKNGNQFIVTMRNDAHMDTQYGIQVDFNGQFIMASLATLCTIKKNKFEVTARLHLRFVIQNNLIIISCDGGTPQQFKIEGRRRLLSDYPIPYSTNNSRTLTNEAHMWLVNHGKYQNTLPNAEQMYGCIHSVYYDYKEVTFTNISSNIDDKCIPACNDSMCNGGHCQVYYSSVPICNCTETFRNGRLCNDGMRPINVLARQIVFLIMFKLSWKSDVNEMLELRNEDLRLSIHRKDANLYFRYHLKSEGKTIEVALSKEYVVNVESICLCYFYEKSVRITTRINGQWKTIFVPLTVDVRFQIFDDIKLRSGEGIIEFAYKNALEDPWRIINIIRKRDLAREPMDTRTVIIIVTTVVVLLLIASLIWLIIYLRQRKRRKRERMKKIESQLKDLWRYEDDIGRNIIDDGAPDAMKRWKKFIIGRIGKNNIGDDRLERMYDNIRDRIDCHRGYGNDSWRILVMFIYARLFIVPSLRRDKKLRYEYSLKYEYLMTLLRQRDPQYSMSDGTRTFECMMDFMEDVSADYGRCVTIRPLIDATIAFIGYYTMMHGYEYEREVTFMEALSESGDIEVKMWINYILCRWTKDGKYVTTMKQYFDECFRSVQILSDEGLTVYKVMVTMVVERGGRWTFTDIDYRCITAISAVSTARSDDPLSWMAINKCVMEIFSKGCKEDILRFINGDSHPRARPILERMTEFKEDVSADYRRCVTIHPLIDATIAFIGRYAMTYEYECEREVTFMEALSESGDISVKMWTNYILCRWTKNGKYVTKMKQYFDECFRSVQILSDDALKVYKVMLTMVVERGGRWTFTDIDYRCITAISTARSDSSLSWVGINKCVMIIFAKECKADILRCIDGGSALTADMQISINCVWLCLRYHDILSDSIDPILSLIDDLIVGVTMCDIAAIRLVETSLMHPLYEHVRYGMASDDTKGRMCGYGIKYWDVVNVGVGIKGASSVILSHLMHRMVRDDISMDDVHSYLSHTLDRMKAQSMQSLHGFNEYDIERALNPILYTSMNDSYYH